MLKVRGKLWQIIFSGSRGSTLVHSQPELSTFNEIINYEKKPVVERVFGLGTAVYL